MRKILIWILPLFALAGCVKEEPETAEGTKARLTLNICEEGLRLAARAADEKAVQDVNVFLYDVRGIARPQHFYVRGDVLECSVPVGEYEVYAVANLHEDMGAMDREELLAYEFRVPRSYASLPMSGQAVCTVGPKTQSVTVSVRRNVAKIVCNISLDGTFYDLKLQSVQMMDMAGSTMLFSENQQARELCSSELSTMASYEVRKASRTYYLAENCRGEVPGIVNQQQKCADNAPEGATFLRIKAQRGSRQVIYDVYLGENNTTNFDVRRNTVYTLKIVIRGEKETDTRVDAFEVGITDNFPYEGYLFEGYCLYEPGKRLNLTVENPQAAGAPPCPSRADGRGAQSAHRACEGIPPDVRRLLERHHGPHADGPQDHVRAHALWLVQWEKQPLLFLAADAVSARSHRLCCRPRARAHPPPRPLPRVLRAHRALHARLARADEAAERIKRDALQASLFIIIW